MKITNHPDILVIPIDLLINEVEIFEDLSADPSSFVKIMDLKFQIGFIVGFLLINLISTMSDGFADYSTKQKNYEELAELYVKTLDYALDDIKSEVKRTNIRSNLIDAYSKKLEFADERDALAKENIALNREITDLHRDIRILDNDKLSWKDEIISLKAEFNDKLSSKDEIISSKDEIISSKDIKIKYLETNVTYLNNSLTDCMVCLHKLSVRLYIEIVERNAFPGWLLLNGDLDRFERWLFAFYFIDGVNMNRIRDTWGKYCEKTKKKCTFENLAAAMYKLYEDVSVIAAHSVNKLTKKPEGEKLELACKEVAGDDAAKDLACRAVWTIQIDYSENARGDAPNGTHSIYYGKLLCSNLLLEEQRLKELFLDKKPETIQACEVKVKLIDVSSHPGVVARKLNVPKKSFIGFSAKCPKHITPKMFREYVLGDQMKSGIKRDQDNQAATLVLYQDIHNPPIYPPFYED